MARRYREARKAVGMSATEAAARLGVSQPTISGWESGRKAPGTDALERMADLYRTTTDYLLGRPDPVLGAPEVAVDASQIQMFNGRPLWSKDHGWLLVNTKKQVLIRSDGKEIPLTDTVALYASPAIFAVPALPKGRMLTRSEIQTMYEVWVEPISSDEALRQALRGWYRVYQEWVENAAGNRFLMDQCGATWMAFDPDK